MASSLAFKPFLGSSRTEGLSGLCSRRSDLRNLSSPSVQFSVRPRTFKKLKVQAAGNTSGNYFRVTTYGEFRRAGVTFVMDGVPPRSQLSEADLQADLNRIRRPGTLPNHVNTRCSLSFYFRYIFTFVVVSSDSILQFILPHNPTIRSMLKGGVIFSARKTIGRVAAGAAAKKILKDLAGIEVLAHKVVLPED
ncbi:hypothetical protein ACLB2K_039753 [Fragaria x ananassa]